MSGQGEIPTTHPPTNPASVVHGRRLSWLWVRDSGIIVSFIILFVALAIASDPFLSWQNLLNLLDQWSPIAIIACAGTMVLIAGGLDLSTGAIFALTGVIAALLANKVGVIPAVGLSLLAAAGFGLFNGLISTVARINSIIATIATGIIFRGLAIALTGGFLISVNDPQFAKLGRNEVGAVKVSIIVCAIIVAASWFVLTKTSFGRQVYAVGGNAEAARLSGVRVSRVRTVTFVLSGLAAGVAGLIVASRISTGQPDAGIGIEFSVIAAIIIGGTSILGGEGAIWRTLLGVGILALIGNGFALLNINPIYQQIVEGGIILAAVGIDVWARSRGGRDA